jgi:hypothetical protein
MDTRQVEEALLRIQEEFEWPIRADRFEVVDLETRTRSHAQLLRVSGVGAGLDLVVKSDLDWSADEARETYRAMKRLGEVFESAQVEGVGFVDALGWFGSPPMVAMPYVDARELGVAVRDDNDVEPYMRRAGAMLATYHRAHLMTSPEHKEVAGSEVTALARRIPGGRRRASGLLERVGDSIVSLFGDATLGNVLLTSSLELVFIDPPIEQAPGFAHSDIAGFVFDLRKKLAGFTATRRPPVEGFARLRAALLEGYFGHSAPTKDDYALIALFEFGAAAGTAKKRWRSRSKDAIWFARQVAGAAARFLRDS